MGRYADGRESGRYYADGRLAQTSSAFFRYDAAGRPHAMVKIPEPEKFTVKFDFGRLPTDIRRRILEQTSRHGVSLEIYIQMALNDRVEKDEQEARHDED